MFLLIKNQKGKTGWAVFSIILISVGIVIGLLVAAKFDLLPFGHTTNPQTVPPRVMEQLVQTGQAFTEIAKVVTPAVVNISSTKVIRRESVSPFSGDPFFRDFFGDDPFHEFKLPRKWKEQSLGSGVIASPDGYIITNNHVIEKAEEIKVSMFRIGKLIEVRDLVNGFTRRRSYRRLDLNRSGWPLEVVSCSRCRLPMFDDRRSNRPHPA